MRARWKSSGIAVLGGLALALIVARLATSGGEGSVQAARSTITPAPPRKERATVRKGDARVPGSMKAGVAAADSGTGRHDADQNDPVAAPTRSAAVPTPSRSEAPDATPNTSPGTLTHRDALDLSGFENEVRQIEADLQGEESRPREDLLAMYGRSAAASGRFDLAAATYAMFLKEFGTEHPYSERIAARLADCLAPLDLNTVNVVHTASGPEYRPTYRMGYAPSPEQLRQAIAGYELLAGLAGDASTRGHALLRMGWVHRALNDWEGAMRAWDRCATEASGTGPGADALWLAAENLSWTNQPASAAERLRRLMTDYPEDRRQAAAADRLESLEAEARRTPRWRDDPVGSLRVEIQERQAVRRPHQVYRDVLAWANRKGDNHRRVAVSRWAIHQTDWPTSARLAAHADLVDGLVGSADADEAAKSEAVDVLTQQIELAGEDKSWLLAAAMKLSPLLRELGRAREAAALWETVRSRLADSPTWAGQTRPERIRVFLAIEDRPAAQMLLTEMTTEDSDDPEIGVLHALVNRTAEEDK